VKIDRKHRALVDVRVEVTPAIQKRMRRVGGTVVNTSSKDHSIVVWMPLLKLEELAADPAVNAIIPAPEATIRK
jgi:starvation-inducible outer membrane lipoprotein